jgi:hypothetical protein
VKIAKHFRPERAIDKEIGRPELTHAHLDADAEVVWATDRKVVVKVPVEVEAGDVSGPLTVDALAATRKGDERVAAEAEELKTESASYRRPRVPAFPPLEGLLPRDEEIVWSVGLNVSLLYRLAQAMGAEEVVLEFTAVGGIEDKQQPVRVTPLGKKSQGAQGLILPVRTPEVAYEGGPEGDEAARPESSPESTSESTSELSEDSTAPAALEGA